MSGVWERSRPLGNLEKMRLVAAGWFMLSTVEALAMALPSASGTPSIGEGWGTVWGQPPIKLFVACLLPVCLFTL